MNYTFTDNYDKKYLLENMMGPNAMRISEELAAQLDIPAGAKILDLGCGMGLSTLLLVKKYGALVTAADLWIDPTENFNRFRSQGVGNSTFPISVDATKGLPFAHGFFDMLFTVDSYHYFGNNEEMLPSLLPFVKKGGHIAMAVPGLQRELSGGPPEEMLPFWQDDMNFYTVEWWKELWEKVPGIEIVYADSMKSHATAWEEWLRCDNPYARHDIGMMEAEAGKYFNTVGIMARVL